MKRQKDRQAQTNGEIKIHRQTEAERKTKTGMTES